MTNSIVVPGARRWFLRAVCAVSMAVAAAAGAAAPAALTDLPPPALVAAALDAHPAVAGARAGVTVEEAQRRRLVAGPYESGVRLGRQSRHDALAGRSLGEWDLTVERTLRLPAKTGLDERLGTLGVEAARLAVGAARHEAARGLLRQWFAWLRAVAQRSHWDEQRMLFARQAALVARRVELGDAARQDQWLAEAAVAQAEAAEVQALTRVEVAAAELLRSYPQLRLPARVPALEPVPVGDTAEAWLARITERNHELALARVEVELRRAAAGRAHADVRPDPTLGLRLASERAGAERVVG
ncbi:MAG: hypothetical protein JNM90_09640, partial [Burkholderiales bacterium]|nr:hypothetical protein [Burkholderiales bacterium]